MRAVGTGRYGGGGAAGAVGPAGLARTPFARKHLGVGARWGLATGWCFFVSGAVRVASFTDSWKQRKLGELGYADPGDLVIATTSENVGDVCRAVAWLGKCQVAIHNDSYAFRHDCDLAFLSPRRSLFHFKKLHSMQVFKTGGPRSSGRTTSTSPSDSGSSQEAEGSNGGGQ